MANEYLYGTYGHVGETVEQNATQASTVPVYVGCAPVNLIRGYADKELVNVPVMLSNLTNAQQTVGYSNDWKAFSLGEAINAHFNNPMGNIGPIYVINVLDPKIHVNEEKKTINLAFSNGQATIKSDTIILDTLVLAEKVEGFDYTVDYNFTKGIVVISSKGENKITGTVSASYNEVNPAAVEAEDIIGSVTDEGIYSGLGALQLLYNRKFAVCNLLAAPGWSHIPAVYNAMITASSQINGHWDAFVCADIPLADAEGAKVDSIAKAIAWKNENGYDIDRSKPFWPMHKTSDGLIYHLSTLAMVEFMRADYSHDSVPMETCGNKQIPGGAQYFGEDSKNQGFDQITAKELTSHGIGTCVFWGGNWVLWGDHTGAYTYGADVDPRCIFDVSMRMLFHITNSFQREWGTVIDEPFTKQLKDRILNREQEKLDSLVAKGALIGNPRVLFLESNNSTTDMMNGDFRWDIPVTPTPPLKSATVYVAYSDAGFSSYFEDEE